MSEDGTKALADCRRRYERIDLPKGPQVAWQGGGKRVVSRVHSLSMGGLFIITEKPLDTGTTLKLMFDVPDGNVEAMAIVRTCNPGEGMGVQFSKMNQEDRARLDKLLRRLLR
ncbi:MAG: PilZ domain-containing protein [Acidobacteriia bacterium]|nr:PilZ domain-containing protein [Terriglobia bacterium]